MKKNFTGSDARKTINHYLSLLEKMKKAGLWLENQRTHIANAANQLAMEEIVKVLRSVPIEELNRDKNKIRVKTLRDHGYSTIADVYSATRYNLEAINGISIDAAYTIKKLANDFVEQTRQVTKIKLSLDDKGQTPSKLVKCLSIYKEAKPIISDIDDLYSQEHNNIMDLIGSLKHASNPLRWLFTSKNKKQQAIDAYDILNGSEYDNYDRKVLDLLRKLEKANDKTVSDSWEDFSKDNINFYNILEDVIPGLLGSQDALYGLSEELAREIQDQCFFPDGLLCTLRKYQEWGVKYILHQGNVLLGDEMGLGKTVQAIATMVSLKNTGATHFIVVCPASVVTNWCREIVKHSKLRVIKVHGNNKKGALTSWIRTGGVAVTTYETVSIFKLEPGFRYSMLIVDEAHYIKNPEARRTLYTQKLAEHADRKLFMTGTALENHVDEMINLIDMLQPQIARKVQSIAFMATAPQFRQEVAPVYYRRRRKDVLTELPEKEEIEEWCTLGEEEERAYEAAVYQKHYVAARRVSWNIDDLSKSCKATRLKELVEEAESEDRKVLVFSFFLDTIHKICDFLGNRCTNPITGSLTPQRRQEIIDGFNDAPAGSVLVAQIQSGGTGLNIQSASVVIICEPQLKPSIENQAISRAYRMGQARNVLVYRLLCENTVDERLMDMLAAKQAKFNAFADESVAAMNDVSIDETTFGKIINEEIDRINQKYKNNVPDYIKEGTVSGTSSYNYSSNIQVKDYYDKLLDSSYDEIVALLLKKYGPSKYDYFLTPTCASKNAKARRSNEGLIIHHIDEDKAEWLSKQEYAIQYPFKYQKADRLVYCNLLEHLILHIKIAEKTRSELGLQGAARFICREINDCYSGIEFTTTFGQMKKSLIINEYNNYIKILARLWKTISMRRGLSRILSTDHLALNSDGTINSRIRRDLKQLV